MSSLYTPRIIVTSGEPGGIGPDLCVKLSQHNLNAKILVLCDEQLITHRAQYLQLAVKLNIIESLADDLPCHQPGHLNIFPIPTFQPVTAGILNVENSAYVIKLLEIATDACVSGHFDAMVTGPIHKEIINQAGVSFTGHTEFIAKRTQARLPVMMLQTEGLRIALATTHLPLRDVANAITADLLHEVINVLHHDLVNKFAINNPVIMVCGLNPHAGEGGYLGNEEIDIIEPVLQTCRDKGMQVIGPLSADTIYSTENLDRADVFLAMYHDQGLPVIKFKAFGEAVNITLGLPIIRTSVDHGTALPLAGTGKADVKSFLLAIKSAVDLAHNCQ